MNIQTIRQHMTKYMANLPPCEVQGSHATISKQRDVIPAEKLRDILNDLCIVIIHISYKSTTPVEQDKSYAKPTEL